MIYNRESDFSHAVCDFLRAHNVLVQRIESGSTGKGIPDIYFASPREHGWIELKIAKADWNRNAWFIRWRTGQQAWMYRMHKMGVPTYTLVAFNDCMILITMDRIYKHTDRIVNYKQGRTFDEIFR